MRNFNEAKAQAQAIITAARKLQKTRNTAGQLSSRTTETISKMEALAKKFDKLPETTMSGMNDLNELGKPAYSADCIAEDIVDLEKSKDKMKASLLANWQLKAEEEKYITTGSEIIGKLPTLEDVLANGCSDTIKPSTDNNTETDTAQAQNNCNAGNAGTPERSTSEAFNEVMNLIEQLGENKPTPIHTSSVPTDRMGSEEADSIEDTNVEITTGDIITEIDHIGHNITINIGGNVNVITTED